MEGLKEEERKKYEEELEAMKKKHRDHKPVSWKTDTSFLLFFSLLSNMNFQLHHPGSKQQLEEVWEKQDHMEDQEFNPKTFFYLHGIKYHF